MRISAKADYAVRAMAELAASPPGKPVKADALAASQRDFDGMSYDTLALKGAMTANAMSGVGA